MRVRLLLVAAVLGACGGSSHPAGPIGGITRLVDAPPSAFSTITIVRVAGGGAVALPASIEADLAPLFAARTFTVHGPLGEYGLDPPVAKVAYLRDGTTVQRLVIGGTDFDAHGFYVQVVGDPAVYLVLSANIRPALAAIGIATPAPT